MPAARAHGPCPTKRAAGDGPRPARSSAVARCARAAPSGGSAGARSSVGRCSRGRPSRLTTASCSGPRQHVEHLLRGGHVLGPAQHDRVGQARVVALGIDDAELAARAAQPLQQRGGEGGLAAARRAGQQHVDAVRRKVHRRAVVARAQRQEMARRGARSSRSFSARRRTSSTTPAPWSPAVTRSARSFSSGSAFATATPHSHAERNAWSFSASPMPDDVVRGEPQLLERLHEPGRLVDSRRQDHDRALVEDHLQLEAQLADGLEHDLLVRRQGGHDGPPHGERRDARGPQRLDQRRRWGLAPAAPPRACRGGRGARRSPPRRGRTARATGSRRFMSSSRRPVTRSRRPPRGTQEAQRRERLLGHHAVLGHGPVVVAREGEVAHGFRRSKARAAALAPLLLTL